MDEDIGAVGTPYRIDALSGVSMHEGSPYNW